MDNLEKLNGTNENRPDGASDENITPSEFSAAHEQEPHTETESDIPKQEEENSSPVPADVSVKSDVKKIPKPSNCPNITNFLQMRHRALSCVPLFRYNAQFGGSPRIRALLTWSGRERSSHGGILLVPRIRLAEFVSVLPYN